MFTYVGLSESQVSAIRERHHIYMLKSGRISISGREYFFFLNFLQGSFFFVAWLKVLIFI